jgi:hypothetical protein
MILYIGHSDRHVMILYIGHKLFVLSQSTRYMFGSIWCILHVMQLMPIQCMEPSTYIIEHSNLQPKCACACTVYLTPIGGPQQSILLILSHTYRWSAGQTASKPVLNPLSHPTMHRPHIRTPCSCLFSATFGEPSLPQRESCNNGYIERSGAPTVVQDPERGHVLYLDGASHLVAVGVMLTDSYTKVGFSKPCAVPGWRLPPGGGRGHAHGQLHQGGVQ